MEVSEPAPSTLIEQSVLEEGEVVMDMETEVEVHTDSVLDMSAPGTMKRKLDFDTSLFDQSLPFIQGVTPVSEVDVKQENIEMEEGEAWKKRAKLVSYQLCL